MPFLSLLSIKDYVYLAIITGVIAGGMYWHHKIYDEGIAKQVALDKAASAKLQAETSAETAALQEKANAAETTYQQQIAELTAYHAAHPDQPVRLCLDPHASGTGLPQTAAAHPKHAGSGSPGTPIQSVSDTNHSSGGGAVGPDISTMLGLLAARADQVSAELREYQSR